MVYIVGKKRQVTVNVAKGGKVMETFVIHRKEMNGDNVIYKGKEYPLLAGNIINIDGVTLAHTSPPVQPKVPKTASRSFRDWDKQKAERDEARKKGKK